MACNDVDFPDRLIVIMFVLFFVCLLTGMGNGKHSFDDSKSEIGARGDFMRTPDAGVAGYFTSTFQLIMLSASSAYCNII